MTRIKIIFCLIISLILESFILCLSVAISTLNQYKVKNMTSKIIKENFSNLLAHPISAISKMISRRDSVLIIGTIILIFYMAYVVYKSSNKGTYKIESKYAVHGSSRFANNDEIFVKDETIGVPVDQMFRDLQISIKNSIKTGGENNENNENDEKKECKG